MVDSPFRGARGAPLLRSGWRRLVLWVAAALLALVAAVGILVFAFFHKFYPGAPPVRFAAAHSVAEAQRQDLEYFRNYLEYNRTYSPQARAQVSRLLEDAAGQAGRMSSAQFDLAVARMTALADNGHSKIYPDILRQRHNKLPCLLYHFSDGYYIVRARAACQALLGARLIAIDGHPVADVADTMYRYVLGPRTHYDQYYSPFYLESPELLNAAGLALAADRVTLRVLLEDGREEDVAMAADPPDPHWPWWVYSNDYLSSEPVAPTGGDWKSVLPVGARLPAFLADFNNPFRTHSWPGIYYAQFRSNMNENGHPIAPFVAGVEQAIAAENPHVVIIDLRFDQGGDFTTTAGLMSRLGRLAPGIRRVYVLISGWTFSAGETSAALAKEHGGDKVVLVGEPLGDRMRFWGEGRDMTLPNSRLKLHYATGLHDYTHPCRGQEGCFWTTFFFPMHVRTLAPDVLLPYTFADYRALRDPVLEYVLREGARVAH